MSAHGPVGKSGAASDNNGTARALALCRYFFGDLPFCRSIYFRNV